MPKVLAEQGVDYAEYREELRAQIVLDTLRRRDVVSKVYLNPREVDDFLRGAEAGEEANQEYKVSHILIGTPLNATAQQREAARERAGSCASVSRTGRTSRNWRSRTPSRKTPFRAAAWVGANATPCPLPLWHT